MTDLQCASNVIKQYKFDTANAVTGKTIPTYVPPFQSFRQRKD